MPLGIAAEGRAAAGTQYRRRQSHHAVDRLLILDAVGGHQLPAQGHAQEAEHAHEEEGSKSHLEYPFLLVGPPQGVGLGDRLGQGYGQAGGGDGQKEIVDVVGPVKIPIGRVGKQSCEGDLVDGADDLDQDGGGRQEGGRTVEGVLFLLAGQNRKPPYCAPNRSGTA